VKNLSWRVILLFLIAFSLVLSVVLIFYPEKTIEKQAIYLRPLDLVAVYKNLILIKNIFGKICNLVPKVFMLLI
jgi:hypothetical protein